MNVAYVFKTDMSDTFQLATMILPQLESETSCAHAGAMGKQMSEATSGEN